MLLSSYVKLSYKKSALIVLRYLQSKHGFLIWFLQEVYSHKHYKNHRKCINQWRLLRISGSLVLISVIDILCRSLMDVHLKGRWAGDTSVCIYPSESRKGHQEFVTQKDESSWTMKGFFSYHKRGG